MRRWIPAILFSILLTCPSAPVLADSTVNTEIPFPVLQLPLGSDPRSNKDVEKKEDESPKLKEKSQNERLDEKVDDAIRKAWDEK